MNMTEDTITFNQRISYEVYSNGNSIGELYLGTAHTSAPSVPIFVVNDTRYSLGVTLEEMCRLSNENGILDIIKPYIVQTYSLIQDQVSKEDGN